jgi:hypothetical protein
MDEIMRLEEWSKKANRAKFEKRLLRNKEA